MKERIVTKKIGDLFILNELNEKAGMMIGYNHKKYDYYMWNDIEWLVEHAEKIREDFEKCVKDNYKSLVPHILINSKYIEKGKYIDKMLRDNDIELFERVCIHYEEVAHKMHLPKGSTIEDCFNKLKSKDGWGRLTTFGEIHKGNRF